MILPVLRITLFEFTRAYQQFIVCGVARGRTGDGIESMYHNFSVPLNLLYGSAFVFDIREMP